MQEFFHRLQDLPASRDHDEARRVIETTLNEVEDAFSGVPFDPDHWRTDGRMYPVQDDNAADVPGHADVIANRSRGHETFIRHNGAIEIRDLKLDAVVFEKRGADDEGVWS